ncbi:MAG TPA: trigger factor [Gemmatimonadaceae bacterium]|nr:trigger factor [Gemmatimonadaceae bacterium]
MDIEIKTKKSEGVERLLEVSIPVKAVEEAEEKTTRRYASSARLPGFRPGKAPTALVRKRFKDAIRQQTLETLLQEAYQEVISREHLKVAATPHLHDVRFDEGKPLVFELHVEVRPEISLGRTQGFRVTRGATTVTDVNVREQLDQLRDQRANWAPVTEKPAPGDMVTVLLATADESGELPEGRDYRIVIGGGQAIPGIEELVMRLAPGETVEENVRWPEDFPDEAQRGKSKRVRVTLQDVKRKALPELDDAFSREVGDFESLDALTKAVRSDLESHAEREADAGVRQQLIDQIVQANAFDVPPSWVSQLVDGYMKAYQIPEEERERFTSEFRPVAERQVRRDLIIETIAEKENLKASEADVDERVADVAKRRNAEPGQVYASLQKAGRLQEIERAITEEKVFKWLLDRNTVE